MLEAAGFEAILTTSAGIAFSLGLPDYGVASDAPRMTREAMLARVAEIAAAVAVPVSADLEEGYGATPADVAQTISLAIDAGVVGANLEDVGGDLSALFSVECAVDRICAARQAAVARGIPFVINARTDAFLIGRPDALKVSIARCNQYRAAGADCVFVPGVTDAQTLAVLVREIDAPLSVVMGLLPDSLSVPRLGELGVRRVSTGGSLARKALAGLASAAQELKTSGTFTYAEGQLSTTHLNRIFAGAPGDPQA